MLKKIIVLMLLLTLTLMANFKQGKVLFQQKCASCHKAYISFKKLKENFYERNNELLNLTIPTENMLAWAIIDGPKKIGTPEDNEMRQMEIEEYLKNYLENPDMLNSICDDKAKQYYIKKQPIIINEDEAILLAQYFMGYKEARLKQIGAKEVNLTSSFDNQALLQKAQDAGKHIMVYATSKSCYFCKKMQREVLLEEDVQSAINEDYIFIKVDVDQTKLPFHLKRYFKGMTPTFFVLTSGGELLNTYPGAWVKEDFLLILKENL